VDEDVTWFEIAMDHSLLMRVLNPAANAGEKLKALPDGKLVPVAEGGQRKAFDELHDEERASECGRAGIVNLGDVRMLHEREGLSLRFKTGDNFARVHARFDDLQGERPPNRFMLESTENDPKSAFPDFLKELEATNPVTRFFGDLIERFIKRGIDPLQSDTEIASRAVFPVRRRLAWRSTIGANGVRFHALPKL
jgi:hypothetical protein